MSIALMGENFNPVKRTIKNNNIFLVTDENGNILAQNTSGYGLYTDDTRYLSRMELKINDSDIIVLSSSTESGHSSIIIGTNLEMFDTKNISELIPQETIQIKRESIIYGSYFETLTIANYNLFKVNLKLELFLDADFLDIFEVREASKCGKRSDIKTVYNEKMLNFSYKDRTGATLSTKIKFIEELPNIIEENKLTFELELEPTDRKEIKFQIELKSTASFTEKIKAYDFNTAFDNAIIDDNKWYESTAIFKTDNEDFNEMLGRGHRDINMLRVKAYYGEYIAAGIPWYTTLFGRDCILAARQSLLLSPILAKSVLYTLAQFQGKENNDWRDEEPGKIPHEIRFGELARNNEIPHSPYYGTVDATPLWLILLHEYFYWTNDRRTIECLWENALKCLEWIDKYALYNGYTCYKTKSEKGIENQGWKDSFNSSVNEDGSLAEPPIALVEVQGYVYLAKKNMAKLADHLGEVQLKKKLLREIQDLKDRFNKDFWLEDYQFLSMGLDKDGNPMKIVTTNPGHCLETGIVDYKYIQPVAERFFDEDMFTGWGIRTLSKDAYAFNPMSYHNGTVWPHDNSIVAYGLSKVGRPDLSLKVLTGLFEAARLMQYKRLPELFCGFSRRIERLDPPVMYPVSCIPQAWAAASVFFLLQAILNIEPDATENSLSICNPIFPEWLNYLTIENLKVGSASVGIEFRKTSKGLVIDIFDKKGKLDIIIRK